MFSLPRQALRRAKPPHPVNRQFQSRSKVLLADIERARHDGKPLPYPKKVIFSGIQPTGVPHLGNYLGALREWVKLQNEADADTQCIFSIVDSHAITVRQTPAQLLQWRKEMMASFLAVGLTSKKSVLFCQSGVMEHAELMWLLSCQASMGYLSRMTQWKVSCKPPKAHSISPPFI